MSLFGNEKIKVKLNNKSKEFFKPYTSSLKPLELPRWHLKTIITKIKNKEINPNPIGQRPPTSSPTKTKEVSSQIIETMFRGYSVGSIILRDISNDKVSQEVYFINELGRCPYQYLVIDGGHRIRAIRSFIGNGFKVFGMYYEEHLQEYEKYEKGFQHDCHPGFIHFYEEYELLIEVYECNESQSGDIFKSRNKSTPVNDMEMIMSNETSYVAEQIRKRVTLYSEYLNKYGENTVINIFSQVEKSNLEKKPRYWTTDVNPRRKWDEYVAVIYLKSIAENNCDSSYKKIAEVVENSSIAMENPDQNEVRKHISEVDKMFKKVDKFFEDFVKIIEMCGKGKNPTINGHFFGAFQSIYFRYMEKFKSEGLIFEIRDYENFAKEFNKFHVLLTGNIVPKKFKKFENTKFDYSEKVELWPSIRDRELVKTFCRKNVIAFSNKPKQDDTANYYIKESKLSDFVGGLEKTRSLSKKNKEELLVYQDYLCATDGKYLDQSEAVCAHENPHSEGGKISNCVIVRDVHNKAMSNSYTHVQYKLMWEQVRDGRIDAANLLKQNFDLINASRWSDKWKPLDIISTIINIQKDRPELV